MKRLEGGECADLPAFIIERYFEANGALHLRRSNVAKAICSQCVVLEQCRMQALNAAEPTHRGVIGGATGWEIKRARQWRLYELGYRTKLPEGPRPEWLTRPEAANAADRDAEPGVPTEQPKNQEGGANG